MTSIRSAHYESISIRAVLLNQILIDR